MNARCLIVIAAISALGVTFITRAGSLNPPTGPVLPTSPSLADLLASINASGGADANAYFVGGDCLAKGELGGGPSGSGRDGHATSPDFTGTDTRVGYEGGIEVLGVEEQAAVNDGTMQAKPIRVLVKRDRAIGELTNKMAMGMLIQEIVIDILQPSGGGDVVVERIHMFDVMVCKITCSPTAGVSVVEFKPATVEKTFNSYDTDGSLVDSYTVTLSK